MISRLHTYIPDTNAYHSTKFSYKATFADYFVRPSVFPFASQIELIELMRLSLFWPDSGIRLEDSVQRFDNVLALVLHHSTHW